MLNKIYCLIRVSTDNQEHLRQENILIENGYINGVNCEYIEETFTGKTTKRPVLEELLNKLQKNDTIVATELSRLSRSILDFNNLIKLLLYEKQVNVIILKEKFDLKANNDMDAMTKLILNISATFAQFERDIISDRTKESLRAKKINGTKSGKPIGHPKSEHNTQENFIETIKYQVKHNCGQYRASLYTKHPTNSYQIKLRECFKKYNTRNLKEILQYIEKEIKYE